MEPWGGDTVLTSAVLSKEHEMVEEVFECVMNALSWRGEARGTLGRLKLSVFQHGDCV